MTEINMDVEDNTNRELALATSVLAGDTAGVWPDSLFAILTGGVARSEIPARRYWLRFLDAPLASEIRLAGALGFDELMAAVPRILRCDESEVNAEIVGSISIGGDAKKDVAKALRPSIEGSVERVLAKRDELTVDHLTTRVDTIRQELDDAIASGAWSEDFPGRSILSQFVAAHLPGVSYTAFRNLIADKMVAQGQQPNGMLEVLKEIEPAGIR